MLRKLLITGFLSLCVLCGFAQNVKDVRINEILVINETNLVDDYGTRSAWIELYNTSHSVINLAGCYLTVAEGNKTMTYRIPSGDHRTTIEPLSYMMFYCDGNSSKGTFYTNFVLDKTGYLAFRNASNELIQKMKYSVSGQVADVSLGFVKSADKTKSGEQGYDFFDVMEQTTVMSSNDTVVEQTGSEKFQQRDPQGIVLAITAMSVVFSALLSLFILFKIVGLIMVSISSRKKKSVNVIQSAIATGESDEVIAAIALAIKLHQEDLHDKESAVLTINRVARAYSPWSSKIYGINQLPNK